MTTAPEPADGAADEVAARALEEGMAARLSPRDVLSVSGPEAASYLQGQCSQDLAALAPGDTTETLVLSPQGKVDAYLRVTRTADDTFVLDGDAGCGTDARARLERFRLRTKVDITTLDWVCLALRGPDAAAATSPGLPVLALPVTWPGWSGVDLLGPPPPGDPELDSWLPPGAVRCPTEPWEAARIEAGVPLGGREVTSATIAAEVGLVERTVSFTKGCFTGQELVARMDARGSKVARHLSGLVVDGGSRPPVGAPVWTADGAHEVGSISSVAYSIRRGATVALATLHRRVGPGDRVDVRWDGGHAPGEVRSLPFVSA